MPVLISTHDSAEATITSAGMKKYTMRYAAAGLRATVAQVAPGGHPSSTAFRPGGFIPNVRRRRPLAALRRSYFKAILKRNSLICKSISRTYVYEGVAIKFRTLERALLCAIFYVAPRTKCQHLVDFFNRFCWRCN